MGNKHWANTWTEIEDFGSGKRSATISVGHRVFVDKADGQPKKHKLTDNRPDHVVIQSAKCCVEVHPYYAKYFDVQHEEVRLHEERWVAQRLSNNKWRDVGAWNPVISVEEYPDAVKVTVQYDTSYGTFTVEYFQRDGSNLKHNVTFNNTSGSTETFRVIQRWAGIVGDRVQKQESPDRLVLNFHKTGKSPKQFTIRENLSGAIDKLYQPVVIESHAQGMKADFVYGDWVLAPSESLEIDPDTSTLNNPTLDGYIMWVDQGATYSRSTTGDAIRFGWEWEAPPVDIYRGYVEWDVSGISGTIDKVEFRYHGQYHEANSWIYAMASQPSAQADNNSGNAIIYGDAGDGTAYLSNDSVFPEVGVTKNVGGGGVAWDIDPSSDLESALGGGWFAFGFRNPELETNPAQISRIYAEDWGSVNPAPTLYVEFTPVTGWAGGDVNGVAIATIAKINGVELADILKVNGVA